jgi:sec-independent protein translocase protein TatC
VIVAIAALAAIVTPPDPGSQVILAIPLLLLFEGSLILMRLQERKDRSKDSDGSSISDASSSPSAEQDTSAPQ